MASRQLQVRAEVGVFDQFTPDLCAVGPVQELDHRGVVEEPEVVVRQAGGGAAGHVEDADVFPGLHVVGEAPGELVPCVVGERALHHPHPAHRLAGLACGGHGVEPAVVVAGRRRLARPEAPQLIRLARHGVNLAELKPER